MPGSRKKRTSRRPIRFVIGWLMKMAVIAALIIAGTIFVHGFVNPPQTFYMTQEERRHGSLKYTWVDRDQIAPVMMRSVVAAEDANFCKHWGFDMKAIRAALSEGSGRGASTITQQVVKNTYLWHGRNWLRKALEAAMTPMVELFWSKKRILEVYLNIAEFDKGVFGVQAAGRHYFGRDAQDLSARQAARLAAVLPSPKKRSASKPTRRQRQRAARIRDGAETIRRDGRSACFED